LLLSVGSARPAAGLVQGRALSLARREGPARRAQGFRRYAAGRHRDPRVGPDRRDAPPGAAAASRRHRRLERRTRRRSRHARLDDRQRLPEAAGGTRVMNGVHDMGGMDGFGKVEPEPNEPVFHAEWEGRVMAMMRAMGFAGAWNID